MAMELPMKSVRKPRLLRIHKNLGHPSNRLLVTLLTEAGAPQSIVEAAKNLHCSICARYNRIAPARPSNPVRARHLGDILAMDFSYHTTPEGIKLMVLHLIDEAS